MLESTIHQIEAASHNLEAERVELLTAAAQTLGKLRTQNQSASLLFVCTHNSRRSQFSDVWAQVAIAKYGVADLKSASCGTEVTECNPRTVASLQRQGLKIVSDGQDSNPHYSVEADKAKFALFSKAFGDPTLPDSNFLAMMCCDDADEKCPVIPGAAGRVPLHYSDPKKSDGTRAEAETYDARSVEIGAEMFFLVRQVAKLV